MNDAQPELLALLTLVHSDVLNVTDTAESTEEFALDEDGSNGNDAVRVLVNNHNSVVCSRRCALGLKLTTPRFLARIGHHGEDRED